MILIDTLPSLFPQEICAGWGVARGWGGVARHSVGAAAAGTQRGSHGEDAGRVHAQTRQLHPQPPHRLRAVLRQLRQVGECG